MSAFDQKYRQPDIVEFEMEDVTFHVRLPTSANRRYMLELGSTSGNYDENGSWIVKKRSTAEMVEDQYRSFAKTCIVRVEGIEFKDPLEFYEQYPGAIEELHRAALAEGQRQEAEASDEVGKSETSSAGNESGETKSSSTTPSSDPAEFEMSTVAQI